MIRIHRKDFKNVEIYAVEGSDNMALRLSSVREAVGDTEAFLRAIGTLSALCYRVPTSFDGDETVTMIEREAVVVLLDKIGTEQARAFLAWLDTELPQSNLTVKVA